MRCACRLGRASRRPRLRAVLGPARAEGSDRRRAIARLYGVAARSRPRGRRAARHEDRADGVRALRGRERRHDRAARSRLSRLLLGRRARRCESRPVLAASTPRLTRCTSTFPSNPTAAAAPEGLFEEAVGWADATTPGSCTTSHTATSSSTGASRQSFLATPGAREVGIELFSMSKSYGMAGWRLGFALGNAELVRRIESLQDHAFAGIFRPVQEAGIAALTGPQDSVEERRASLRAPSQPGARGAGRARGAVGGDVLRLVPPARRRRGRASARRASRRRRAGRGLRRARSGLGAPVPRSDG